jgi:hypothetical protein
MAALHGEVFLRDGNVTFAIPPNGTQGAIRFEVIRIHPPGLNFPAWVDLRVNGNLCRINPDICQPPFHRLADCVWLAAREREKLPVLTVGSPGTMGCAKVTLPPHPHPEAQEFALWRGILRDNKGFEVEAVMIDTMARLTGFRPGQAGQHVGLGRLDDGSPMTSDNIPGWFNARTVYDLAVTEFDKNQRRQGVFVEIGAWLGQSTAYLASKTRQRAITLFVVDTWRGSAGTDHRSDILQSTTLEQHGGDVFDLFLTNMEKCGLAQSLIPLRMFSTQAVKLFSDASIDFCFIDAAHDYASVKADLAAWFPKVRQGGIIGGDDFGVDWPGVDQAVSEFFGPLGGVSAADGCWYYRKP